MNRTEQMLKTHPQQSTMSTREILDCLEACMECQEICNACADACVGEENVSTLSRCIRLNNDCADICEMAGRILSRQNSTDWDLVESVLSNVILASNLCADECEKHEGHHEHCRICAEVCRNCAEVCHGMIEKIVF